MEVNQATPEVNSINNEVTNSTSDVATEMPTLPFETEQTPPKELSNAELLDQKFTQVMSKIKKEDKKPKKLPKEKIKLTKSLTANFTHAEFDTIKKVIDFRMQKGIITSHDHFVRQCIDFALCHGTILTDFLKNLPLGNVGLFAIPNDQVILPMEKKGFFKK